MEQLLRGRSLEDQILLYKARIEVLEQENKELRDELYKPYKGMKSFGESAELTIIERCEFIDQLEVRLKIPALTISMSPHTARPLIKELVFDKLVDAFARHLTQVIYKQFIQQ